MASQSFYTVVSEAIRHFEQNGFTSAEELAMWTERIRKAAVDSLTPESVLNDTLTRTLGGIYKRLVDDGQLLKANPGIPKYTIERLKPKLRTELDRRMMVSRSLIKLNREQSVQKVTQRFAGWASSIPAGGSRAVDVKDTKDHIRKALTSLSFEDRRVAIDQSHKFTAALNEIVAVDGGAIAMRWNSQWKRPGYQYRKDHKERDQKVYLLRSSWAKDKGLVKPGPDGYYDDITKVGEEVYCSCFATWIYNLRDLPEDMITQKGKDELAAVRAKIAAMRA
jgi:hypothetical protein